MGCRKIALVEGCYYHICTKSIAGFEIFRSDSEYRRMSESLRFYQMECPKIRFSWLLKASLKTRAQIFSSETLVGIVAYCLMPTHLHLFLIQKKPHGISNFMMALLNSYARYFNIKTKRKGPLWESRFKAVLVKDDVQALHLTRYIHLNPTSAGLVQNPLDWKYSSYREYLGQLQVESLCEFKHLIDVRPDDYRAFVEDRIDFQKKLQIIKSCVLE